MTWITPLFHAEHMAEFYYQLEGNTLTLKLVIENTEASSFTFNNDCNFKEMNALCFSEYINNHSYIELNSEKINLELENSYVEKGHLIVNLSAKINSKSVEELTIYNNCFYEFNLDFKNRVLLDIKQFQSSYLLTKDKANIYLK